MLHQAVDECRSGEVTEACQAKKFRIALGQNKSSTSRAISEGTLGNRGWADHVPVTHAQIFRDPKHPHDRRLR